jgi:hypothetical protein
VADDIYESFTRNRKKAKLERLRDKYLTEKVINKLHVVVEHRAVGVIILPKSFVGMQFVLKLPKGHRR